MFDLFISYKNRLGKNNMVEVNHDGDIWVAAFEWHPPTTEEAINKNLGSIVQFLPDDFVFFLSAISNGAILFHDQLFGQWGYQIYGLNELLEKQDYWRKSLPRTFLTSHFAFGELIGDPNVLLFDLGKQPDDDTGHCVYEGNAYDPIEEWPVLSNSFESWLNKLVTEDGKKYWD